MLKKYLHMLKVKVYFTFILKMSKRTGVRTSSTERDFLHKLKWWFLVAEYTFQFATDVCALLRLIYEGIVPMNYLKCGKNSWIIKFHEKDDVLKHIHVNGDTHTNLPIVYPRFSSLHRGPRRWELVALFSCTSDSVVLATGGEDLFKDRLGMKRAGKPWELMSTDWDFCFNLL